MWRLDVSPDSVVAKVFDAPRGLHAVKTLMRGRPGATEFRAACYGAMRDLPVIRPIAWGQPSSGRGPFIYLSTAVTDAVSLQAAWVSASATVRRQLIHTTADMLAKLHVADFRPFDVHPENILVRNSDDVLLADLHGAAWGRHIGLVRRQWNLAELNQWFQRHARTTERLRFLNRYLSTCGLDLATRRGWTTRVAAITQRRSERIAAKKDGRIFGDNKFVGRIELPDGWRACVFLMAKTPLNEPVTPLTRDAWSAALRPLVDAPSAASTFETLTIGARTIGVTVVYASREPATLRRQWRDAFNRLNRHEPAAQPLALVERRKRGHLVESLLVTVSTKE